MYVYIIYIYSYIHSTKTVCPGIKVPPYRDIERKFDPGYSRFFKEYKRKVEAQYKVQQGFHVPTLKLRIPETHECMMN